jgi:hypothetical protein
MYRSAEWFRGDDSTTRTRLVMIGAFVGALVVLATSVAFSWPVTVGVAATSNEAEQAFNSPPGTCLTWANPTGADIRRVACAQPHVFEMTGTVDISAQYPANAPSPALDLWQKIKTDKCTPSMTQYLGGELDPYGKFSVDALKPTDAQWTDGDRKVRCGIQRAAPSGSRLPTTGSAAHQDQSNVYDPGTCLALTGTTIGDPVDCQNGHAYEIVGLVDLSSAFSGSAYPDEQKQGQKLLDLCGQASKTYTGGTDLTKMHLTLYWDTLKKESWAAGSRKIDCKVGAVSPDGKSLRSVAGSVRKDDTPTTSKKPPATTPTKAGG